MILLHIPELAPSANRNTRFGKGRAYSSPRYREWMKEYVPHIQEQANGAQIKGAYKVSITAARPDKRRRDVDNQIKPISDLLQRSGVIEDDCYCEFVSARWVTVGDGIAIRIEKAGVE